MNYSRLEQETIINFNEEEPSARIYTFNRSLQTKLRKLAADRLDECQLDPDQRLTGNGAAAFIVPKTWIKVRPPKAVNMTEDQKQALRARMGKLNAAKSASV